MRVAYNKTKQIFMSKEEKNEKMTKERRNMSI